MEEENQNDLASQLSPSSSESRRVSRWRWIALGVVVAGAVSVGVLGYLLTQTMSDKDDAETSLEASQNENEQLSNQLASSEQEVADMRGRLSEAQGQLTEANNQLTQTESDLAKADADLADVDAQLEEAAALRQDVVDFLAMAIGFGVGLSDSDAACLASTMAANGNVGELLEGFLAAGSGAMDPNDPTALGISLIMLQAAQDCGIALGDLSGPEGDRYGDNPFLDSLHDDCAAGSGFACDQLYLRSASGSEYEMFGATCGDRFSVAGAPMTCQGEI